MGPVWPSFSGPVKRKEYCELLVDGDAIGVDGIRKAIELLEAQGWQLQTTVFATPGLVGYCCFASCCILLPYSRYLSVSHAMHHDMVWMCLNHCMNYSMMSLVWPRLISIPFSGVQQLSRTLSESEVARLRGKRPSSLFPASWLGWKPRLHWCGNHIRTAEHGQDVWSTIWNCFVDRGQWFCGSNQWSCFLWMRGQDMQSPVWIILVPWCCMYQHRFDEVGWIKPAFFSSRCSHIFNDNGQGKRVMVILPVGRPGPTKMYQANSSVEVSVLAPAQDLDDYEKVEAILHADGTGEVGCWLSCLLHLVCLEGTTPQISTGPGLNTSLSMTKMLAPWFSAIFWVTFELLESWWKFPSKFFPNVATQDESWRSNHGPEVNRCSLRRPEEPYAQLEQVLKRLTDLGYYSPEDLGNGQQM